MNVIRGSERSFTDRLGWCPSGGASLELAIHRRPGYPEQLRKFSLCVFAGVVQRQKMPPLGLGQFRLLAFQSPLRFGDRHSLAGAHPDHVRFELGHHSQDVEQQPAYRISRVEGASAKTEHHPLARQLLGRPPLLHEVRGAPGSLP